MVWYNYRRVPAIALARQLIDEGRIGQPYHYRALFLQDWTMAADLPQGGAALWRLDAAAAGSGVTGDLLAHSIDVAMWLNGPITRVVADTETFVKERVHQATGQLQPVGIDDACTFLARFANGSMGTFESTRYARGHKALKTFELNGADGSLAFDLHDSQWLSFFEYRTPAGEKTDSHTDRLAEDPRHELRAPVHGPLVGAGPDDRLRAHLRACARRFPARRRDRHPGRAHLPHRAPDPEGVRRRARIGEVRQVGRDQRTWQRRAYSEHCRCQGE